MALATLECPNATPNELARFLILAEIDALDIKNITSSVRVRELNIPALGAIVKKDSENRLTFAGDQFDILYLKHAVLNDLFLFGWLS